MYNHWGGKWTSDTTLTKNVTCIKHLEINLKSGIFLFAKNECCVYIMLFLGVASQELGLSWLRFYTGSQN